MLTSDQVIFSFSLQFLIELAYEGEIQFLIGPEGVLPQFEHIVFLRRMFLAGFIHLALILQSLPYQYETMLEVKMRILYNLELLWIVFIWILLDLMLQLSAILQNASKDGQVPSFMREDLNMLMILRCSSLRPTVVKVQASDCLCGQNSLFEIFPIEWTSLGLKFFSDDKEVFFVEIEFIEQKAVIRPQFFDEKSLFEGGEEGISHKLKLISFLLFQLRHQNQLHSQLFFFYQVGLFEEKLFPRQFSPLQSLRYALSQLLYSENGRGPPSVVVMQGKESGAGESSSCYDLQCVFLLRGDLGGYQNVEQVFDLLRESHNQFQANITSLIVKQYASHKPRTFPILKWPHHIVQITEVRRQKYN